MLDISYDVHCLSQIMHKPLQSHLKIALKVLRYLKGSLGKRIHIVKCPSVSLETFMDVDWAKCVVTSKSFTGFYLFLNGSLVSQNSKRKNTLSKSSAKAEYRDMASATLDVVWSVDETVDTFTKGLDKAQHENLISKLGLYDVFKAECEVKEE
ncbi:hypothetical protein Tco_0858766 [Tanacetum coccineum]|uniref:Uncharacterized protein n=1 Tax=Tanacetum coccineum TaxID=301880 RepID=A0ABQ5BFR3_9ASTR